MKEENEWSIEGNKTQKQIVFHVTISIEFVGDVTMCSCVVSKEEDDFFPALLSCTKVILS